MADEKKSLISLVPESVDQAVGNLTGPVTQGAGNTLGDIWFLVFGGIQAMAEKKKLRIAHQLKQYEHELEESVKQIPEGNRQEPKLQVVGPALDKSRYSVEEEDIRSMFVKLISRSMDNRYNKKVHPSFPEIISQMSPLDAQNLTLFQKTTSYPVVEYQFTTETGASISHFTNAFLGNPEMINDLSVQASSLTSLVRMGLVSITYSTFLTREHAYDAFETHPKYDECIATLNQYKKVKPNFFKDVVFKKGVVELTPLGNDFISVCLAPNPS